MTESVLKKIEDVTKNIKVLEKIGTGNFGVTGIYKCIIEDKYEAILKISKGDVEDVMSIFGRLVDFNEYAKKQSDVFMTLKDYGVIKNCDYTFEITDDLKQDIKQQRNMSNNKKDCIYTIYHPLLEDTLNSVKNDLNDDERVDMIKTISKSVNMMNKAGYYHRDLHDGNIMFKKENGKYKWYIIDYDVIYNYKYEYNLADRIIDEKPFLSNDIIAFIYRCLLDTSETDKLLENQKKIAGYYYIQLLKTIRTTSQYAIIKSKIPSNTPEKHINVVEYIICIVLFPDDHLLAITGPDDYEKYKHLAKQPRTPELVLSLLNLVRDATNFN